MADSTNNAGKSTREMADKRRKNGIFIGVIAIVALLIIFFMMMNYKQLGIGGGTLLILLILVKMIEPLSSRAMKKQSRLQKRAIRGAKGEEKVGEILSSLGENYLVIHDVSSPYGNIDHIVLSKTNGLYLIETKAHGGKVDIQNDRILVNGKDPEKDFIAQTLRNTYWLRDKVQSELGIKIWISPIIVFTNAFVKFGKPVKGITITNKKYLLGILQKDSLQVKPNAQQLWNRLDEFKSFLTTHSQ